MSGPKPTLGYPSRTAAVQALRAAGITDPEIAQRIGIRRETVAALAASGERRVRPAERNGRTVVFPVDILTALAPHAVARGISVNELARRVVEAVVDDNLVTAVLDDMPEIANRERGR